MPEITIQGSRFDIPDASGITPGTPMTEGHVAVLRQTRLENIRNNFAKKVKDALGEGETLPDDKHAELQSALADYASKYEFGVRSMGTRAPVDPIEREALRLAKQAIADAYREKYGKAVKGEELAAASERLLEARGADFRTQARKNLRDRERAAQSVLDQVGLAA